jgi:GntR family transcriptional regulator
VESGQASVQEAQKLAITIGAPVRRLLRIRLFRNRPTILERVVVSESVLPGLGDDKNLPDHLFRYYEAKFKVTVVDADEYVRAVTATAQDAELLEVPEGMALLEIDRLAHTVDHRPVEWRLSRCDTSNHDYRVGRG